MLRVLIFHFLGYKFEMIDMGKENHCRIFQSIVEI